MEQEKYNRIKAVLADKEVSGKELGEKIGRTRSIISAWCNNRSQPSIEHLYQIANFLEVEVFELLISNKK
jgi:transcriptional regulator with XRE-family HTH domain